MVNLRYYLVTSILSNNEVYMSFFSCLIFPIFLPSLLICISFLVFEFCYFFFSPIKIETLKSCYENLQPGDSFLRKAVSIKPSRFTY